MRTRTSLLVASLLLAPLAACATNPAEPGGGGGVVAPADPFAPMADTSEGLTNVSADLDAVLEKGALAGACAAYASGQTDRKTRLLCGKYTFFYEGFGTAGVPTVLVQFLLDNFPEEIGQIEPPVFPSIERVDFAEGRQLLVVTAQPGGGRRQAGQCVSPGRFLGTST